MCIKANILQIHKMKTFGSLCQFSFFLKVFLPTDISTSIKYFLERRIVQGKWEHSLKRNSCSVPPSAQDKTEFIVKFKELTKRIFQIC